MAGVLEEVCPRMLRVEMLHSKTIEAHDNEGGCIGIARMRLRYTSILEVNKGWNKVCEARVVFCASNLVTLDHVAAIIRGSHF
jgi:hypothetical protein